MAPDFELPDQHGTPVRLSGLRGKPVVIVFFPFAFTGICQGELHALKELGDTQVVAVSADTMFALRAWADREGYSFPLLSDFWPHGQAARAYGVFDGEKGFARRGTFILDGEGVLRWQTMTPVGQARDVDEYREVLTDL